MHLDERNNGLLPWTTIAQIMGMDVKEVRKLYDSGIMKIRKKMLDAGVSEQEFAAYIRSKIEDK